MTDVGRLRCVQRTAQIIRLAKPQARGVLLDHRDLSRDVAKLKRKLYSQAVAPWVRPNSGPESWEG